MSAGTSSSTRRSFVVVGGGIAGVSAMNELLDYSEGENEEIDFVFICGRSGFLKTVRNYEKLGVILETFDVELQTAEEAFRSDKKVRVLHEDVIAWDPLEKTVRLSNDLVVPYSRLCIATGARPRSLGAPNERVLQIRDTDTIEKLQHRLEGSRRVVILGDGGIALEAAYELKNLEIVWASKLAHVGSPFFDATIALALEESFTAGRGPDGDKHEAPFDKFSVQKKQKTAEGRQLGCALGPNWLSELHQPASDHERRLDIRRCVSAVGYHAVHPKDPADHEWPLYVEFSDGDAVGCDLVIEALGVIPQSDLWKKSWPELKLAPDGGIQVDERMRTNADGVFACGDVCTIVRHEPPRTWKQMRLWSQARVAGVYTARCMLDADYEPDHWLDLFAHVTTFGGKKVVLLGDFLAETGDVEHVFRADWMTRVALENNRVVGAILVGQTDLDEVFETLILNSFEVSTLPRPIVNQQIDIADFFD